MEQCIAANDNVTEKKLGLEGDNSEHPLAKAHHGVQRGVVDEGTGVEGAVGCDLKETRDGDSLGGHQALKLGRISTKFGKEGFRAEQDWF